MAVVSVCNVQLYWIEQNRGKCSESHVIGASSNEHLVFSARSVNQFMQRLSFFKLLYGWNRGATKPGQTLWCHHMGEKD